MNPESSFVDPYQPSRSRRFVAALPRLAMVGALTASLSAALVAPVAAQGEPELPSTAAVVPEDALFYLSVELDLSADQWAQADDLLTRAGAPGALQELRSAILDNTALATPTAGAEEDPLFGGELGVVFAELPPTFTQLFEAAASGTPAAAATPDFSNLENEPGPAFVLEPGDPDAAAEIVGEQLAQAAEAAGTTVEETTYGDVAIQTVDNESGPDLAVAQLDEFVIAAFKPADLEPIIDTAAGDNAPLSDFAPLADVRAELNDELLLFGFLSGEASREAFGPAFAGLQQRSAEFSEAYGIASPVAQQPIDANVGIGLWADEPGFRLASVTKTANGEPYPEVIEPRESALDARVPADTLFFFNAFDLGPSGLLSTSFGLQAALAINQGALQGTPVAMTESAPTLDQLTPEYVEEQFDRAAEELGFDLRTDLLNQLAGEHALSFGLSSSIFAGEFENPLDLVFASDLEDPATVADSVERVARLLEQDVPQADVSTREVGGETVYVVSDPEDEESPSIEFGVIDEQLLVGLGNGIDEYVAGPAETLADDERYQRVMATLPTEYQAAAYVNVGQFIGLFQLAMTGVGAPDRDATFGGTPVATPGAVASTSAVEAFAFVATTEDDVQRTIAILYIGEN